MLQALGTCVERSREVLTHPALLAQGGAGPSLWPRPAHRLSLGPSPGPTRAWAMHPGDLSPQVLCQRQAPLCVAPQSPFSSRLSFGLLTQASSVLRSTTISLCPPCPGHHHLCPPIARVWWLVSLLPPSPFLCFFPTQHPDKLPNW